MSQRRTENRIFRLIFRIGFGIMTVMILQNTIPDSTYFELKVLRVEYATLESYKKKSVECRSKDQSREFSELYFKLALAL